MALTKAEKAQLAALQAKAEAATEPPKGKRRRDDDGEAIILRGSAMREFLGLVGADDDEDQDDESDEEDDDEDQDDEEDATDPPAPEPNRFFRRGARG